MEANVDWSLLSEADKIVLKSLGMVEPKPKGERTKPTRNPITVERRMSTRDTCPEPYYVKIFSSCSCCKTKSNIHGKMDRVKPSDNCLRLVVQEIPEGEIFRQLKVNSVNCSSCTEELSKLSVEELVNIIKVLHEIGAKKSFI